MNKQDRNVSITKSTFKPGDKVTIVDEKLAAPVKQYGPTFTIDAIKWSDEEDKDVSPCWMASFKELPNAWYAVSLLAKAVSK